MMGEAKRRGEYAKGLAAKGIHSLSGYDVADDMPPLARAILKVFHEEAARRPEKVIPAREVEYALLFHLCQTLRATPQHYKDEVVEDVIKTIRDCAYMPFKDGAVMTLGDELGEA